MTCNIFRPAPMTLREAKEILGQSCEFKGSADARMGIEQAKKDLARRKADWDAAHASTENIAGDGPMFLCGDLVVPVCACGRAADNLCDYPMGDGKTCDIKLCDECRHEVGEDLDLCRLHYAEWSASSGVARVNPWPPPRSKR